MLRITQRKDANAAARYYTVDDLGQKAEMEWGGELAEEFGLVGQSSDYRAFNDLLHGTRTDTGGKLTQRMRDDRVAMWDYTFLAPKSVSIMAEVAGDTRLNDAFKAAVSDAMAAVERDATTRSKHMLLGMREKKTGNLLHTTFLHRTGRPDRFGYGDPHLHSHVAVLNVTKDKGRFQALKMRESYFDNSYYAAVFHSSLSHRVASLGYDIRAKGKYWEIAGVSDKLIEQFSKRGQEMEKLAAEKGVTGKKQKARLASQHRTPKGYGMKYPEVQRHWRDSVSKADMDGLKALAATADSRWVVAGNKETKRAVIESFQQATAKQPKQEAGYRRVATSAMQKLYGQATPQEVEAAIGRSGLHHHRKSDKLSLRPQRGILQRTLELSRRRFYEAQRDFHERQLQQLRERERQRGWGR